MKLSDIRDALKDHELKVTPQRIAVLQAIIKLNNHPTAEQVIEFIKINHPNVAIGTVYKILDTLVDNGLIRKVKTDRDIMRYDAVAKNHHHLYCYASDRIEDYFDEQLDQLLNEYFTGKDIPGFKIQDVKLQIIGKFSKTNK